MLEGFVPVEVHEHFDSNDVRTGYTVVRRESEWDEATLERVIAAKRWRDGLCPCGCGQPAEIAWDPTFEPWSVDTWTCYARKALEQVRAAWEKENENSPAGWSDGVHHFVVPADGAESHPERASMTRSERGQASRSARQSSGGSNRMTRRNGGD